MNSSLSIEQLVEKATNENLESIPTDVHDVICDKMENDAVSIEIAQQLSKQIQDFDSRVTKWTLYLAETCMKHGNRAFYEQMCATQFIPELTSIADGSQGPELKQISLNLIQDWGIGFRREKGGPLALFHDTYTRLKMQSSVVFPPKPSEPTIFPMETKKSSTRHEEHKLLQDLNCLEEKLLLCSELRVHQTEIEALEEVEDFLQQCQPRMNTLIEAGMEGKLDEKTLQRCLELNDNLVQVLEHDEKKPAAVVDLLSDLSLTTAPPAAPINDTSL